MRRPFLTVLTTPILDAPRRLYRTLRSSLRPLVKPGVPLPEVSKYPGHFAAVRSVVEGLDAIGADFNHDPRTFSGLARVVYAPANEALRQAAQLKREGRIDCLVAGPSNALFPEDAGGILRLPEIDLLIVASEWVKDLIRPSAPELLPKIQICAAGVNTEVWKRASASRSQRGVVYWKSGDESFCVDVEDALTARGLEPIRIRYGDYKPEDFRRALDGAPVAVFLSSFETQGLALAEAWAMDVPTLVWNPQAETSWRGRSFIAGSSAPYLTRATGEFWATTSELGSALEDALRRRDEFHPREWVLANMTDARCAAVLLDLIRTASFPGIDALTAVP